MASPDSSTPDSSIQQCQDVEMQSAEEEEEEEERSVTSANERRKGEGGGLSGAKKGKMCLVCGDKALGYNFNAVSCESCKAFFRRNAHKTIWGRCEGKCEVTVESRSFCKRCRLAKCFTAGMKKDMILNEAEKVVRNRKILTKKLKRQGQLPPDDEATVSPTTLPKHPVPLATTLTLTSKSPKGGVKVGQEATLTPKSPRSCKSPGSSKPTEAPGWGECQMYGRRRAPIRLKDQVRAAVSQLPERQQKLVAELKYAMKTSSFLGVTSTSVSALPTNPTEFINLAEGFVRKVIKVAKNIASFKTLQKDDQIWLLKGSVVDIMMLRSLINYDPSTESWSLSTRECLGQKTSPPSSTTTQATSPVNPTSPTTSPTTTTAVAASSVSGPAAASSKDAIGSGGSPGGVSVSGGFPGSLRGSDGLPRGLGCFEGITGMADSGGLPDMTGSCGLPGGTGGSGGLPVMTCSGGLPGGMGGPGNFPGMTGSSCVPGMPCSGFTPETISFGHFTGMSSSGYPGAISPSSKPGELYHSETISYMDVSSSVSPIHDVTSPFSFSLGSMGFDQPESSSSPHCLPHSPEDVSSGGSPFSPPQYFLTTPMSSPGTAASSHLVSSSGLTSPGLEFNPSWPSGETLKASACVDVMPKRLVSTGVMMETSASTGVMMETSASTGMVMETANAPRVTPETSDPTGVSLETSATAGMTSSETSGSNRISAELLKRGSPEMVKLFMNYSRFVGSLMSNIQGDVLVLEVLIMMSLFSADRTTLLAEREKVQAIQEEYASVLQFYTKTRFSEDKSLFARLVMKLADLRDINEVHSKMLLAMKVSELELLLLEIFDL